MNDDRIEPTATWTAFHGHRQIAHGTPSAVLDAVRRTAPDTTVDALLVFDDANGQVVDTDHRVVSSLASDPLKGRGRPRLGVVAREVTLLPRHWDWLNRQRGGASAALRRLIDEARGAEQHPVPTQVNRDAAYRVLTTLAGDWPNYEEALRALFADDLPRFRSLTSAWPGDVGAYGLRLGFGESET